MQDLDSELQKRWNEMFVALATGDDVAPASRLRAEGMMEAAVLTGTCSVAQLTRAMSKCYQAAYGHSIAHDFGEDWQEFFPFPQIPAMAKRAPVYPSTKD